MICCSMLIPACKNIKIPWIFGLDRIDEVDLDDVDQAADIVGDFDLYDGKTILSWQIPMVSKF